MNINDPTHPRNEGEFTALLLAIFGDPRTPDEAHIAGVLTGAWGLILAAPKPITAVTLRGHILPRLWAVSSQCGSLRDVVRDFIMSDIEEAAHRLLREWLCILLGIFTAYRASREIEKLPRILARYTEEPTP
jgi:hypothetical protein